MIIVYDEHRNAICTYSRDMEPEVVPGVGGGFEVYYLSGFEKEDGTKCTSCHYPSNYSYIDTNTLSTEAKLDSGKPKLTLVPRQIIFDIARVREYGVQKYKDPDNWKKVEIERYRDAAFRHFMAYLDDPYGVDAESGLTHLSHLACNIAFLCELQKEEN